MNPWIVFGGAVLFRLLECTVKSVKALGKINILAILKEFCQIS